MKYYFTTVRMAILKEIRDNKYWRRCREKRALVLCTFVGHINQYSQTTENTIKSLQEFNLFQHFHFYISKGNKIRLLKDICTLI